jgi:hypothetical protein
VPYGRWRKFYANRKEIKISAIFKILHLLIVYRGSTVVR